jgi:tRNA 2-selenouridine synthase
MEMMRASPCVSLMLSRANRVRLLIEDYDHFMKDPALLNAQLDHLVQLHGRAKIDAWHELANSGRMAELVDQLLVEHYDPAYLRSIDRNFVQFPDARVLEMGDIAPADFLRAAQTLNQAA